jgi:hypothetical protein
MADPLQTHAARAGPLPGALQMALAQQEWGKAGNSFDGMHKAAAPA